MYNNKIEFATFQKNMVINYTRENFIHYPVLSVNTAWGKITDRA